MDAIPRPQRIDLCKFDSKQVEDLFVTQAFIQHKSKDKDRCRFDDKLAGDGFQFIERDAGARI